MGTSKIDSSCHEGVCGRLVRRRGMERVGALAGASIYTSFHPTPTHSTTKTHRVDGPDLRHLLAEGRELLPLQLPYVPLLAPAEAPEHGCSVCSVLYVGAGAERRRRMRLSQQCFQHIFLLKTVSGSDRRIMVATAARSPRSVLLGNWCY